LAAYLTLNPDAQPATRATAGPLVFVFVDIKAPRSSLSTTVIGDGVASCTKVFTRNRRTWRRMWCHYYKGHGKSYQLHHANGFTITVEASSDGKCVSAKKAD
jgi:hypothetical protein